TIPKRRVKRTDWPREYTAKTQPIPSKPPAFDVVGIKTDDLINFTPALREEALAAIKDGHYRVGGPFAPPSAVVPGVNRGTIVAPGFGGGGNWMSGASDSETGFIYV